MHNVTVTLGKVVASHPNRAIHGAQLRLSEYQIRDNVPMFALHGIISRPMPGAHVVVLMPDGDPSKAVAVGVNDARYNPADLPDGTVGIHHHGGAYVLAFGDRIEVDGGGRPVVIRNASLTTIEGDVKIKGKLDVTGEVTAMVDGAYVTLSQHKGHTGGGQAPTPNT